jgi:tetratricopeptide (TPR) repeat protein
LNKAEKSFVGQKYKLAQKIPLVLAIAVLGLSSLSLFISDIQFNALMKSQRIDSNEAIRFSNSWPNAKMSFLLTTIVQAGGDFKSAEAIARNAAKYDPLMPEAWYLIGVSRSEQLDFSDSLEYVKKSLALDKFNTFFMLKKAYIFMDLQDFTAALKTINEIEDLNPSQGGLLELIADYERRAES